MNYPHVWTGSDPHVSDDLVHVATTGIGGVQRPACDRDNVVAVVKTNPPTVNQAHLTCPECVMLLVQDTARYTDMGPGNDYRPLLTKDEADKIRAAAARSMLKSALKPARHAVGRLSARFDQIKAAADREERDLTPEEWADLRGLHETLDDALGEFLGDDDS